MANRNHRWRTRHRQIQFDISDRELNLTEIDLEVVDCEPDNAVGELDLAIVNVQQPLGNATPTDAHPCQRR